MRETTHFITGDLVMVACIGMEPIATIIRASDILCPCGGKAYICRFECTGEEAPMCGGDLVPWEGE